MGRPAGMRLRALAGAGGLALALLCAAPASAQPSDPPPEPDSNPDADSDSDSGDEDWGDEDPGFGELGEVDLGGDIAEASPWSLTGFVRSDWGLWLERFDDNPWAKGRQMLDLELRFTEKVFRFQVAIHGEYDFAYLHQRDSYDEPTLDAYEWIVDLRESFFALSLSELEVTIGWQIVAWGQGDAISPIDVVNPRDLREPGLADLDDLRLPVLATRVGWFKGYHRVEGMVIHEAFFGYRSPPFGPFSPLATLLPASAQASLGDRTLAYEDRQERFHIDNQQFLLRWSYKGPGLDLAVYGANVLDKIGTFELPAPPAFANDDPIIVGIDHGRYWMVGHSGAVPVDAWLFKWELYADLERDVNAGDTGAAIPVVREETLNLVGGMLGVTWQPVQEHQVALELAKSFVLEDVPDLLFPIDEPQLALRSMHNFLRDDLTLSFALSLIGWTANQGWLGRAEISYVIEDGLKVGGGFITYQPTSEFGQLSGLDTHDRFFAKLRWDFTLL